MPGLTLNSLPESDPNLPTRTQPVDPLGNLRYPLLSARAMPPQAPLPNWLPQNVQNYIRTQPSYGEGDLQAPYQYSAANEAMAQDTPPQPYRPSLPPGDVKRLPMTQPYVNPQPNDISQLFGDQIRRAHPDSMQLQARKFLPQLMQLPGFAGFTGGSEI